MLGRIIEFRNGPDVDFEKGVVIYNGVIQEWNIAGTPPDQTEIDSISASQAFLDWEAENGGDPVLTSRRIVKEAIDTPTGKVLVAFIMELLDRNIIPGSPAQVKQALLDRIANGEVD